MNTTEYLACDHTIEYERSITKNRLTPPEPPQSLAEQGRMDAGAKPAGTLVGHRPDNLRR